MLVRRDEFRASKAMMHRVLHTHNIEILYNTETKEILGDGQVVTGVKVVNNKTNEEKVVDITGFFVAIGHNPNTDIFRGWLKMDETGYIITKPDSTETNVEGVFCCGDAQDHIFRQAITAAGTGCMAAIEAERYLAGKEHIVTA
jgi:thioredoxin reductase (NADPH)